MVSGAGCEPAVACEVRSSWSEVNRQRPLNQLEVEMTMRKMTMKIEAGPSGACWLHQDERLGMHVKWLTLG